MKNQKVIFKRITKGYNILAVEPNTTNTEILKGLIQQDLKRIANVLK